MTMSRKVLLPRDIERRLDNLTGLVQEVEGILLYRRQGDYCPLEEIYTLGVGAAGHVRPRPEKSEVADEFFRRNPDYRFVQFHTHSKVTIERSGQYYARHFSQGDIDSIKDNLRQDREFMALLVTPETKLISGIDNPQLLVVDNFRGYAQRSYAVVKAIEIIERSMGYENSRLKATKFR